MSTDNARAAHNRLANVTDCTNTARLNLARVIYHNETRLEDWSAVDMVLADLATARAELEAAQTQTVLTARACGISWAAIGDALGITRQAAQQRYGHL